MEKEDVRKSRWGCLLVIVAGAMMFFAGYGIYALFAF